MKYQIKRTEISFWFQENCYFLMFYFRRQEPIMQIRDGLLTRTQFWNLIHSQAINAFLVQDNRWLSTDFPRKCIQTEKHWPARQNLLRENHAKSCNNYQKEFEEMIFGVRIVKSLSIFLNIWIRTTRRWSSLIRNIFAFSRNRKRFTNFLGGDWAYFRDSLYL